MIQETEDMINLVKSSKYKGDKTEIEICSDYIKDLKKHKLKKIKSIKEKGEKNVKNVIKTKNDNKISHEEDEDRKDYNSWIDIDDDMNEKGEILIKKNTNTSQKEPDIKINVNKKEGKPSKKEKNSKTSIKDPEIDDYMEERNKMAEDLLAYSEMGNHIDQRKERINQIGSHAQQLLRDSETFIKAAKNFKKSKNDSWSQYNSNDFKVDTINKSKIICFLSFIFIIIIIMVTLIVLFFH